ncbi:hypothetical protein [Bailinhaonella thermotolerans]|uniref:Uncharacterized protein n=1 Tax=Bailinhaonella thermotolerans TaxID=1070861 RepID=A0A3A4APB1_9ACTN|nr:hypothetical protein [Bailinhaonella thermotolerans]RJL21105.1 hypothetical protein D5H75_38490 [Bailinhaonella thermotolerans]
MPHEAPDVLAVRWTQALPEVQRDPRWDIRLIFTADPEVTAEERALLGIRGHSSGRWRISLILDAPTKEHASQRALRTLHHDLGAERATEVEVQVWPHGRPEYDPIPSDAGWTYFAYHWNADADPVPHV